MFLVLILICASALAISFLCSLTEAVLLSLNPLSLRLQAKKNGTDHIASRWLAMKNQFERPVSSILVFNTLAGTGCATLAFQTLPLCTVQPVTATLPLRTGWLPVP